jgi:phenylacetate-CoA ligase
MLDESQWWPAEKLIAWQRQHLQLLLNHARASSPFYKFRLNKVFLPGGGIDWDRWHEIPILTRADVVKHRNALLSTAPVAEHGPFEDVQSSGSTGDPVKVRTSRWLMQMAVASNWRMHKWEGLDWSRNVLASLSVSATRKLGDDLGPWGPPWIAGTTRGRFIFQPYGTPMEDRLRLISQHQALYHSTTPPAAERLAERAELDGVNIHLDAVLARGGAVSDDVRNVLRDTFGARVIEAYSSKEAGAIAQRCPFGEGYHGNAEAVLLEVVDASGVPVAPGQSGRAVVTPFASTAMPLIRYDQGDVIIAGDRCSCGRTLPHFQAISGRERGVFLHPNGGKSDPELRPGMREMIGAGRIQIAQLGPTQFEVRYTPHDWGVARDEAKFVQMLRSLLFEDSEITLLEMAEIPLSPSGKFLASVTEWRPGR